MANIRARALVVLRLTAAASALAVTSVPASRAAEEPAAAGAAKPGGAAKPAAPKPGAAAKPGPAAAKPDGGAPVRPRFVIKAEKGFIDDPFAIDPEGGRLAVLLTDAASFARIDLIDLDTGKPRKTIEVGDPQRLFERIVLVPGGKGAVLVSRDPRSNKRAAQYFDEAGTVAGSVGPYDDFGVATRAGETLVVALQKSESGGGDTTYTVAAHRPVGLAHAGKPIALTVSKAKALAQPPLEDVEWQDGFTQLLGVRRGEVDKKTGAAGADRAVVVDALSGAVSWEGELGDKTAFRAVRELRRKLPGRSAFLMFSPDTHTLELFDFLGRHAPVVPSVSLAAYDATTLVEAQDFTGGGLLFSLALDREKTSNPLAKKPFFDLYRLEPQAAKPGAAAGREPLRFAITQLLRAPADDRPVAWAVRGKHAAVLRKHKDFSRGGAQLEVYGVERKP